jgi:predicted DCC family thiol-disulfide oxidoreductase YuxK
MSEDRFAPDGLWLFDGVCNLCDGLGAGGAGHRPRGPIRFTPIQSPMAAGWPWRTGSIRTSPTSFLFLDGGQALEKSAAILALLRRLGAPWSWLAVIDRLPRLAGRRL